MMRRRHRRWALAVVAAVAVGAGQVSHDEVSAAVPAAPLATTDTVPPAPPPTSAPATSPVVPTSAAPPPTLAVPIVTHDARLDSGVLAAAEVSAPQRLIVADLGIDAPIDPVGVDEAGALAIPDDAKQLVWWQHGPAPGAPGSAVIAGHLDWRGELGTFNRLGELPSGALIEVVDDAGVTTSFVVSTVELVDKAQLEVDGTFTRDGPPVLRLVTCGGAYDADARRYLENVVVTATPVVGVS